MRLFRVYLLGILTAAAWAADPPKHSPPDVFLITIDTLRADHVHCYGDEQAQTPTLDSLAQDGIRFSQAFTASPITNISHASILTGLLPSNHGVSDFGVPLSPDHPEMAEWLKPLGYHTAAFIGAVVLDSKQLAPGFDRGFDFYDNFTPHLDAKVHWGRVERRGMDVVQDAEKWLDGQPAGPRFVWVHLYDPHDPYEPPEPFLSTYKERPYDGEIAYADSALGNFIAYLKKQGWYDDALIIAMSDHGEGLGEHDEDTHGVFLYDTTLHVPLIVKLPSAQAKGRTVDAQVRSVDVLPTVLNLTGAKPPQRLDGEPLQPYFAGPEAAGRTALAETDYPIRFGWAPLRSVRDSGMKFIEAPRPELYDLRSDPKELHNTYQARDANVQKLSNMLALRAPSTLPDAKDHVKEQNLLHQQAILAETNKLTDQARDAFHQAVENDSNSPAALLQTGQIALAGKNYSVAAGYLKRAYEASPGNAEAAFSYGEVLQATGDLTGARDAVQASLKADPNQPEARVLLGQVDLGLKDMSAAQDEFEAALLMQPASVDAQVGLAEAFIGQQKFHQAVPQLLAATQAEPNNAHAYDLLAKAYTALGEKEKALAAAKRARALQKP